MDWKLALVQHPMYLLIKEDTQCAERTPPWGAPSIEAYTQRLRGNLSTLKRYPGIKLGYEWSGLEVEQLAQDAPDVFDEMVALAKAGRTTFYNGTYSQPHLQTLSSEANYRQFEFGMRVYRQLCGRQVHVYAHQEASVHDQLPQLLKAFGISYATIPGFLSTLGWLDEGELMMNSSRGTQFLQGHEFVNWQGLDGTQVPLYLHDPIPWGTSLGQWLARQAVQGLLRVPPLLIDIPDMVAVDDAWVVERAQTDVVLLDEVLPVRLEASPPQSRARFYTNWSYIEGIRAEELARCNWRAEAAVLNAEGLNALAFALGRRPSASTDAVWRQILAAQHHDVYCFCAPELRGKAIGWLQEAQAAACRLADDAAESMAAQIRTDGQEGDPLVVFSALPQLGRALVTAEVPSNASRVVDDQRREVPAEVLPMGNGRAQIRFLVQTEGLGYKTYRLRPGGSSAAEETAAGPVTFENDFFRAVVQTDGTFSSLALQATGDELLDPMAHGNRLAATDSTGISPRRDGPADIEHRQPWDAPARGPDLNWVPTAPARIRRSSLGLVLTASGRMGPRTRADLTVRFYRQLPRIDLAYDLSFENSCIGTFYDDETKLRVQWPMAFGGDITQDIAFGVIQARDQRPFFPASWVDISDGTKGLAYFNQGTPKHWVCGRTLVNLFAWGEDTDAIGNRMEMNRWGKCFDQRLRGSHTIQCAIYPHPGDWRAAGVMGAARSYGRPPLAYLFPAHPGAFPDSQQVLALPQADLVTTAVKVQDSRIVCRGYSVAAAPLAVEAKARQMNIKGLESLSGEPVAYLQPFQIGHFVLEPRR